MTAATDGAKRRVTKFFMPLFILPSGNFVVPDSEEIIMHFPVTGLVDGLTIAEPLLRGPGSDYVRIKCYK
jgi:hypothetical protein